MSDLTRQVVDIQGYISPKAVADVFHTTLKEIAVLSGLSIDAVSKRDRIHSKISQKRLRDMVLIINRVEPWCGSSFQAYAWYRSQPLPGFGDLTAEALVKQGRANDVMAYLDRIAEGGYA